MIAGVILGLLAAATVGAIIVLTIKDFVQSIREYFASLKLNNIFKVQINQIMNSPERTVIKFSALDEYDDNIDDFDYIVEENVSIDDDIYEGAVITI